jgi:hypothetical protein
MWQAGQARLEPLPAARRMDIDKSHMSEPSEPEFIAGFITGLIAGFIE